MNSWGKIAIGKRIGQCSDPLFERSWGHLLTRGLRPGDTLLDPAIEMPHHFAANVLVKYFLKSDADTLCVVDADMIFPPETLIKLRDDLAGQKYDILSALSVARRYPFAPIVLTKCADGGFRCCKESITGEIANVDLMSMGFCLIRRTVFEKMQSEKKCGQWFFNWGPQGQGEDTSFSLTAKELGFKIGVHTGLSIGHRGQMVMKWNLEKKCTEFEQYDQLKELIHE